MVHMFFRMFAALASGTVDQSVLKKPKNPLLDLKPRTPPPPEPEEETRWGQIIDHNTNKTIERPSIWMVLREKNINHSIALKSCCEKHENMNATKSKDRIFFFIVNP